MYNAAGQLPTRTIGSVTQTRSELAECSLISSLMRSCRFVFLANLVSVSSLITSSTISSSLELAEAFSSSTTSTRNGRIISLKRAFDSSLGFLFSVVRIWTSVGEMRNLAQRVDTWIWSRSSWSSRPGVNSRILAYRRNIVSFITLKLTLDQYLRRVSKYGKSKVSPPSSNSQ